MEPQYVRAIVAYDGTDFLGYQWQSQGRTVQGVLEAAIDQVAVRTGRVTASGRTDTGVHADGQVIGFRAVWKHPLPDLMRALNAVLPLDVAVRKMELAAHDWHPRFSAQSRRYRYTILNQELRSPIERRTAHWMAQPLDLQALQAAAKSLVGEHDFASFGQPTQGSSTVRVISCVNWRQNGRWLIFDIVGNAFLRGMVRRVVGTLLPVGLGQWSVDRVGEILQARDIALAAPPAPACGLCLMQVEY